MKWRWCKQSCSTLKRGFLGSQVVIVVKIPPASTGDTRDVGLIPAQEDSFQGVRQPTPVFLLTESMGREAWQATAHGVTRSKTQLKQPSMHVTLKEKKNRWFSSYPIPGSTNTHMVMCLLDNGGKKIKSTDGY